MSRVDEALRRAEAMPIPPGPGVAVIERPAPRGERLSLEDYPREELSPVDSTPEPRRPTRTGSRAETSTALLADQTVSVRIGKAFQGRLAAIDAADPAAVEQYRRLAATLHHLQLEQGLRKLMVSSSVPCEGKTLTVVNLAMTLSESYGRRVLLIDADLRRPSIHHVFGISNRFGLCDALRTEREDLAFAKVSPALWVLPAGSPGSNPMATLTSHRMERFLDEVSGSFDWILLDAPPAALMADAGVLARLIRAVILVISAGSTPYSTVERIVGELGREHIVGTVLNRVEGTASAWSEYYRRNDSPATPNASSTGETR